MDVQIIETGARVELSIIDPKSGMDWTNDLMGNYGALPDYDDETDAYMMSQADYDWWASLIDDYQRADYRMYELRRDWTSERDDGDEWEFDAAWEGYNTANDLEEYPGMMEQFCDQWESDHA
ncbi:MAG: hypothetical protein EOM37_17775 [Proteobacteria bacterium]|nr:hypothetical protein [Pseudomonadota bacterium]